VPNPVPDVKLITFAHILKTGDIVHDPDPCFADVGSHGCKTGFVDDAGIQQYAEAWAAGDNLDYYTGQTPPW
jgi:hypothetical protein